MSPSMPLLQERWGRIPFLRLNRFLNWLIEKTNIQDASKTRAINFTDAYVFSRFKFLNIVLGFLQTTFH
jgi:hypothetical protein